MFFAHKKMKKGKSLFDSPLFAVAIATGDKDMVQKLMMVDAMGQGGNHSIGQLATMQRIFDKSKPAKTETEDVHIPVAPVPSALPKPAAPPLLLTMDCGSCEKDTPGNMPCVDDAGQTTCASISIPHESTLGYTLPDDETAAAQAEEPSAPPFPAEAEKSAEPELEDGYPVLLAIGTKLHEIYVGLSSGTVTTDVTPKRLAQLVHVSDYGGGMGSMTKISDAEFKKLPTKDKITFHGADTTSSLNKSDYDNFLKALFPDGEDEVNRTTAIDLLSRLRIRYETIWGSGSEVSQDEHAWLSTFWAGYVYYFYNFNVFTVTKKYASTKEGALSYRRTRQATLLFLVKVLSGGVDAKLCKVPSVLNKVIGDWCVLQASGVWRYMPGKKDWEGATCKNKQMVYQALTRLLKQNNYSIPTGTDQTYLPPVLVTLEEKLGYHDASGLYAPTALVNATKTTVCLDMELPRWGAAGAWQTAAAMVGVGGGDEYENDCDSSECATSSVRSILVEREWRALFDKNFPEENRARVRDSAQKTYKNTKNFMQNVIKPALASTLPTEPSDYADGYTPKVVEATIKTMKGSAAQSWSVYFQNKETTEKFDTRYEESWNNTYVYYNLGALGQKAWVKIPINKAFLKVG